MSDARTMFPQAPVAGPAASGAGPASRVTELRVSANLMTFDAGLYYIFKSASTAPRDGSGLPGVRVSLPPGPASRPEVVSITTVGGDGWLGVAEDAALVRVASGRAQVLVTIYQSPAHAAETAPRLRVERLGGVEPAQPIAAGTTRAAQPAAAVATVAAPAGPPELVAHVARAGDVTARVGDWIGSRGSKQWIEGFGIAPRSGVAQADIEYQAVLGRGWLSPWVEGGKFCGSRGMALPVLGLRVRLRGAAADTFTCSYSATFVDGTAIGPVGAGEACEAPSLSPLEAFQLVLRRKEADVPVKRPAARPEPPPPPPRTPRVLKSATPARRTR